MRLQLPCSSLQSRRSLRLSFGGDSLLLKLNNLNVCFSVRLARSGTVLPIMSDRLDTTIRVQRFALSKERARTIVQASASVVTIAELVHMEPLAQNSSATATTAGIHRPAYGEHQVSGRSSAKETSINPRIES